MIYSLNIESKMLNTLGKIQLLQMLLANDIGWIHRSKQLYKVMRQQVSSTIFLSSNVLSCDYYIAAPVQHWQTSRCIGSLMIIFNVCNNVIENKVNLHSFLIPWIHEKDETSMAIR